MFKDRLKSYEYSLTVLASLAMLAFIWHYNPPVPLP